MPAFGSSTLPGCFFKHLIGDTNTLNLKKLIKILSVILGYIEYFMYIICA